MSNILDRGMSESEARAKIAEYNRDAPFPMFSDSLLKLVRDYWRTAWDDAPGFVTAVDAAERLKACENEMKRRGIQP